MSSPYRVSLLFAGFASLCAALTMAADATTAVSENGTNVYVAVSRAELHSGPSADFYPTLTVPQGTALEVYHRTADGWLGVRPPPGSFSWVAASDAYLLPGGRMIEITTDAAVSWIGTTLGSAKQYRWQVQLHQGEQLAVLGEKTRKTAAGNDILWYQISPPAGEFRWIRSTAVRDSPPERRNRTSPSTARDGVVPPQDPSVVTAQYAGVVRDDVFSTAPSGEYYPAAEGGEIVLGEGESYAAPYYEGPIVEGGVGEVYGPGYEDGYYPDGYYEDGGYEGGYYADGEYLEPVSPTVSADPFAGYHAFDFT
ncbi:MAG: hypothetical protein KDA45_07260, partial [Planctomycetales bacterium]|nr:hypothetical protein [Planctomycetales bacterium]